MQRSPVYSSTTIDYRGHCTDCRPAIAEGWRPVASQDKINQKTLKRKRVSNIPQFLVHSPKDNVGVVVVEELKAGTDMLGVITETNTTIRVTAKQDIPIGHKVALIELKEGDTVVKYGEDVGRMVGPAKTGEHVHIHNHRTKRW
jgi:(2R)-sulfolactate sulfo-lyase subunit alpha